MNLTSVRLYLFLLILFALLGISSVYADYYVNVSGWYVDNNGNHTFNGSANVSDVISIVELVSGNPRFGAYYKKVEDIEGIFIWRYAYFTSTNKYKLLKSTFTVNGTSKSFYLNHEHLYGKCIYTTFVFLPKEIRGSGDRYEWHIEGVIKYRHRDDINHIDNIYNKTFSDSGTISVGGVVVRKYFVTPQINLHEGGFVMVMKCYKEDNKTIINVTIFPTYEEVDEESPGYSNKGYFGSGNITINNETFPFEFRIGDAYWICFGNTNLIKTYTWNVTNAPTVGSNQPVKSPIPPMAIIIALLAISIIVLRKLN